MLTCSFVFHGDDAVFRVGMRASALRRSQHCFLRDCARSRRCLGLDYYPPPLSNTAYGRSWCCGDRFESLRGKAILSESSQPQDLSVTSFSLDFCSALSFFPLVIVSAGKQGHFFFLFCPNQGCVWGFSPKNLSES